MPGDTPRQGFAGSARLLSRNTPRWGAATAKVPLLDSSSPWSEWVRSDASPLWARPLGLCSLDGRGSRYGCAGSVMAHFHDLRANALSVDAYVRHPECRSSCDDAQRGGAVKAVRRLSSAFSPVYYLSRRLRLSARGQTAPQLHNAKRRRIRATGDRAVDASTRPLIRYCFFFPPEVARWIYFGGSCFCATAATKI